jgi:hypothetical protein
VSLPQGVLDNELGNEKQCMQGNDSETKSGEDQEFGIILLSPSTG